MRPIYSLSVVMLATCTSAFALSDTASQHPVISNETYSGDLDVIEAVNLTTSSVWVDSYTAWSYQLDIVNRAFPYERRSRALGYAIEKLRNVDIARYGIQGRVKSGKWLAENILVVGLGVLSEEGMEYGDVAEVLDGLQRWNERAGRTEGWRDRSVKFLVRRIDERVFAKGRIVS